MLKGKEQDVFEETISKGKERKNSMTLMIAFGLLASWFACYFVFYLSFIVFPPQKKLFLPYILISTVCIQEDSSDLSIFILYQSRKQFFDTEGKRLEPDIFSPFF